MKPLEKAVAKGLYDTMNVELRKLNWLDKLTLKRAYDDNLRFEELSGDIQKHFLIVALGVVQALNRASASAQPGPVK